MRTSSLLLVVVAAVLQITSAAEQRSNLRYKASVSPLIRLHADALRAEAAAVTTTAASVWPAEALLATTTAKAPGAAPQAAAAAAAGGPKNEAPSGNNTKITLNNTAGAAAPAINKTLINVTEKPDFEWTPLKLPNVSAPCPPQMNLSDTLANLQNAAQLSAQAAQAALNAVHKAGTKPSSVASVAYSTANEGAMIWEKLLHTAVRAEQETLTASGQLRAMKKISQKAAQDYESAVMKVRDFPPHIPAVKFEKYLAGIHRT